MLLPKKWLKEYIDFQVTDEEFVEKMMWRGFELAGIEKEMPGVEGVVVGRVLSVVKHDNSDHLHICKVDVGNQVLTIVTGADNVFDGALVPVALVGATLSGHVMEPVNMRGVMSYGMLCSGGELGLTNGDYPGSEVHGILILGEDHPLGQPIPQALGFDDEIFEFELTPNRPDCASIIGMCREAAAALGQPFHEPVIKEISGAGKEGDYASVTVDNFDLCPRYTARVVTDIKIEPSPAWMQKKLRSVGFRPINNIVDITNYVLAEYGHPMHAFDLACVKNGHIVVRNAMENEVVTTLDDKPRPVTPDMLLIADDEKGVGIAGVMGGLNSEITENTKAVLFESAVFKSSNIRSTARKLHHTTDAAARFIKGVEPVNALLALNRAVELVEALKAGKVVGNTIDVCQNPPARQEVDVSIPHINALLALHLTGKEMEALLGTIQIPAIPQGDTLKVCIPHFRTDIECGIEADWDIAEEIARLYGYYNIAPTLMKGDTFRGAIGKQYAFEDAVKDTLAALGGYEMYNYNFTGPAVLDALRLPEGDELRKTVRILNPFGEDQSLMRTTLLPGMLDVAARNLNRKTGQTNFFEIGNVHFDLGGDLPQERQKAGLILFDPKDDFFSMKGMVSALFEKLGIQGATYQKLECSYLQPGRAASIFASDGELLGILGEVHPLVVQAWKLDARIYMAELSFDQMLKAAAAGKRFSPLPRFPLVQRDLAVVVDKKAESVHFQRVIENADVSPVVENVALFDTYSGPGLLPGKKSLAFSFTLRSDDHTLSDEEIKLAFDAIIDALKQNGAPLRS
jgi:phenylalanyl-tRNA synthetase beta chain